MITQQVKSQLSLFKIAENSSESPEARIEAVKGLSDQNYLSLIAKSSDDWRIRRVAVNCLVLPAILRKIIRKDENEEVKRAAQKRLKELKNTVLKN
ncbi:MAG: HEAT repeat domain-containing protein [Candidatus Nealsonbacteria bacterium]|nr:HEAT repeat domain-containing protein [Candidatus Nealsonbacteria bacterium]